MVASSISGAALPLTIAFVHDSSSTSTRLVEQEGDHRLDLGEEAHALLDQRGDRREDVARGLAAGEERAWRASRNSSTVSARR